MARVTIEDCSKVVKSRFELVALASHRTKQINAGANPTVTRDNDKDPVIALREIANGSVSVDELRDSLIKKHQNLSFQPDQEANEFDEDSEEIINEISSLQSSSEQPSSLSNMYSEEVEGELSE